MPIKVDAIGATNGAPVTTTPVGDDTAAAAILKGTGTTVNYSSARGAHGNSVEIVQTTSGQSAGIRYTMTTYGTQWWATIYVNVDSLPSGNGDLGQVRTPVTASPDNSSPLCYITLSSAGLIHMRSAANSGAGMPSYGTAISTATNYRIDAQGDSGTTSSNGTAAMQVYGGANIDATFASGNYLYSSGTITGRNMGAGAQAGTLIVSRQAGGNAAWPAKVNFANWKADGGSTTGSGPYVSTPVASFTATPSALTVAVDAAATTAGTTPYTYSWNWGDGTSNGTGVTASHTYSTPGPYTITLTVTDAASRTGSTTRSVTVATAGPTATFTATPGAGLSTVVTFTAAASTAGSGSIASYAWDWGDGSPAGSGVSPSHTYSAIGAYVVTLTVTNSGGSVDTATQTVVAGTYKVLRRNGFEGQTNGAAVTIANSSASGTPLSAVQINGTGTITYDTTQVAPGGSSASLLITSDGAAASYIEENGLVGATSYTYEFNYYYDTVPSGASAVLARFYDTTNGTHVTLGLTTGGKLQALNSTAAAAATATSAWVLGHWYRVRASVVSHATAGTVTLAYWLDNTGSPVETITGTAQNTLGTPLGYVRFGATNAAGAAVLPRWRYDNLQAWDMTVPMGAYVNQIPPVGSITTNIDSTAATAAANVTPFGSATISSIAWAWGDGATSSGASATHTYSSAGTRTVTMTATDSNGLHLIRQAILEAKIVAVVPEFYGYVAGLGKVPLTRVMRIGGQNVQITPDYNQP